MSIRQWPESAGILVGELVKMRADYLRLLMDLLRARLEPGERILARGRAFEPHSDSFELSQMISGPGCAVVVTDRRVLWVSRSDRRWVRVLPFTVVRSYLDCTQAHRYSLVFDHERLQRWQWVPAHRVLGWSWVMPRTCGLLAGACLGSAVETRPPRERSGLNCRRPGSRRARHDRYPSATRGREVPYKVLGA
jgi:hypothetical protein